MSLTAAWVRGTAARRRGRVVATVAGVAVAVALLACLGAFLAASKATMTERAAAAVGVDWQVQLAAGTDPGPVLATMRSDGAVTTALPVQFGATDGFSATVGGSRQATGPGVVLGLPAGYAEAFPGEVRVLAGSDHGALIAQQTASNLHVAPGDTVLVGRPGLAAAAVRVSGVVDLPMADSLFQQVGAPPQSQPAAPPDNVLLLPSATYRSVMEPLAASRPDLLTTQIHVALTHALPPDPAAAYVAATAAARNLEARLTGAGRVGDNLAAVLDAARGDAAYSQVLFLFLGVPGAALAGVLTFAVAASGAVRRRQDQALLRTRGARLRQVAGFAAGEALLVGGAGGVLGLGVAALVGRLAFGSARLGATPADAVIWTVAALVVGLGIAAAAIVLPAVHDFRVATVAGGRVDGRPQRPPRWLGWGADILLLAASAVMFWITSRTDYSLVVAPEGVPSISVNYWAFVGPALLWVGAGLLTWRLTYLVLRHGRRAVAAGARPLTGNLATTAAAGMSRRRATMANSVVLLALAVSFAASTAIFNATYRAQAEVDARLTNGADVAVTEPPGSVGGPALAASIATVPGVRSVEPLQHRFAYVGSDLQDLYGVRPATIAAATSLQDGYFQGGTATELMARLAAAPDAILVSSETVSDFQLAVGDLIRLRIQDGRTKKLTTVAFHYAGVAKEFPTAPHDSFFVANADYVARATGSDAVGVFLVDTGGGDPAGVAAGIRASQGPGVTVTDITSTRASVGSSLTSIDLAGLTRVELVFALLLAAAAGGLVLALGLAERRRTFAISSVLGASPGQLRGLVLSEAAFVLAGGLVTGAVLGWISSVMLVAVLTEVFDPPPSALAVPWAYLLLTAAVATVAIVGAASITVRRSRRPPVEALRAL